MIVGCYCKEVDRQVDRAVDEEVIDSQVEFDSKWSASINKWSENIFR